MFKLELEATIMLSLKGPLSHVQWQTGQLSCAVQTNTMQGGSEVPFGALQSASLRKLRQSTQRASAINDGPLLCGDSGKENEWGNVGQHSQLWDS